MGSCINFSPLLHISVYLDKYHMLKMGTGNKISF